MCKVSSGDVDNFVDRACKNINRLIFHEIENCLLP